MIFDANAMVFVLLTNKRPIIEFPVTLRVCNNASSLNFCNRNIAFQWTPIVWKSCRSSLPIHSLHTHSPCIKPARSSWKWGHSGTTGKGAVSPLLTCHRPGLILLSGHVQVDFAPFFRHVPTRAGWLVNCLLRVDKWANSWECGEIQLRLV